MPTLALALVVYFFLLVRSDSLMMSANALGLKDITAVIGDYTVFLARSIEVLEARNGMNILEDCENFKEIDHICYRVSTNQQYEQKKTELQDFGVKLIESLIGNRPISIFMLHEPILYDRFRISLIELPAPKIDSPYEDGLEHFEIVVAGKDKLSISDMEEREYLEHWSSTKFPRVIFDARGLSKDLNCDLAISISKNSSCKFHCFHLNEIIAYEKANNLIKSIL